MIFWLIVGWLSAVYLLLLIRGIRRELSDGVLIALLSTTTINVVGLLYVVARYLFPSDEEPGEGRRPRGG